MATALFVCTAILTPLLPPPLAMIVPIPSLLLLVLWFSKQREAVALLLWYIWHAAMLFTPNIATDRFGLVAILSIPAWLQISYGVEYNDHARTIRPPLVVFIALVCCIALFSSPEKEYMIATMMTSVIYAALASTLIHIEGEETKGTLMYYVCTWMWVLCTPSVNLVTLPVKAVFLVNTILYMPMWKRTEKVATQPVRKKTKKVTAKKEPSVTYTPFLKDVEIILNARRNRDPLESTEVSELQTKIRKDLGLEQ
jgi:hypothetical protein